MRELTPDRILEILSQHRGAEHGCTVTELVQSATQSIATPGLERRARSLIEQLRRDGHHVAAHPSRGYFMAQTAEELDATCSFLYARAMTTLAQVAAMKRVSLPDLRGQLRLRT